MDEYRVKPGQRFGAQNQYGPGDKVLLSPEEAQGFLDKLEPLPLPNPPQGEGTVDGASGSNPWGNLDPKTVALLEAAGLTPDVVQEMADDELLGVKGVGPATLLAIRGAWA